MSGYALVVAKGGLKIKPSEGEGSNMTEHGTKFAATRVSMDQIATWLARILGQPVVNETNLDARLDFTLEYADPRVGRTDGDAAPALPSIFTALSEQLGLKLEPRKLPVEVFVVDHAERLVELAHGPPESSWHSAASLDIKIFAKGATMSIRPVKRLIKSKPTLEGAGVHLRRAFGFGNTSDFDPFLLLDDFRNDVPEDYLAGFPWHPHRGIETITYVLAGTVEHGDSMGNRGAIAAGDVQWMTAGQRHHSSGDAQGRRRPAGCTASSCGPTCRRRSR